MTNRAKKAIKWYDVKHKEFYKKQIASFAIHTVCAKFWAEAFVTKLGFK